MKSTLLRSVFTSVVQAIHCADSGNDLGEFEMPVGDVREQHAVWGQVRGVTAQGLPREQMSRERVG